MKKGTRKKGTTKKSAMRKKAFPVIFIIFAIIVLGAVYVGKKLYDKYSYSNEWTDAYTYFGITDDSDVAVVLGNEINESFDVKLIDGNYYAAFDDVQTYLNDRFYYGVNDGILVYTTASDIITSPVSSSYYYTSDGTQSDFGHTISLISDDTLYVAIDYVKKYTNFYYETFSNPNHIQITTEFTQQTTATLKKNTNLRLRGGVKAPILESLYKGDSVVILEEYDNWSKVKSSDSYIGYVENKFLSNITTSQMEEVTDYVEEEYTSLHLDEKVSIAWQSIGGVAGNSTSTFDNMSEKAFNVISPTWFQMSDNSGSIESFASLDYVNAAHNNGVQVWPTLDNFNNYFFSSGEGSTQEVLSSATSRANLINNLMSQASTYGIDGINVDLEFVGDELTDISENGGEDYIEFIRELSIACRKAGLVLSVDVPVPLGNSFFHRKELGTVCDYVVIMGYDEHYAGSSNAGSVASITYVEQGIKDTLESVSSDKIINGIPFYTRIWYTASDGTVTSKAVGMSDANNFISSNGISLTWDSSTGQYYGSMTLSDGTLVEVWLEDATSIQEKLSVMQSYGIAGVAEWKLGFETDDIWDIIESYLNS